MKNRKSERKMQVPILPLSHHNTRHSTATRSRSAKRSSSSTPFALKCLLPLSTVIILLLIKFDLVHISPLMMLLRRHENKGNSFSFGSVMGLLHYSSSDGNPRSKSNNSINPADSPSWHEDPSRHPHEGYRPLVISGPSGVGKGTLIHKLVEFYNLRGDDDDDDGGSGTGTRSTDHDFFGFSVSHTTRKARPGELDGIHYHFKEKKDVLAEIEQGKFIEHAEVHGNLYGTSYEAVQSVVNAGKICILDIDVEGAKNVKKNTSLTSPYFIFVAPPSMQILEKRLRDRGTETEEAIQKRTANAQREMDYGTAFGNFDEVLVNDDLESAFLRLRQILEEWYPHLNQVPSLDMDVDSDLEL